MGRKKQDTVTTAFFAARDMKMTPTTLQKPVLNLITSNRLTIITGDPGTTKSYMALLYGIKGLLDKQFEEIIISKSPVETGKELGFLPGTVDEKLLPYKESYMDIITDIVGETKKNDFINGKKIRFEPLGFVRSKTFKRAFIILDEAQNCKIGELMSFYTRIHYTSKMVMMGDEFQADIKNPGLKLFTRLSQYVDGVGVKVLGDEFQMRDPMITEIYKNYKNYVLTGKLPEPPCPETEEES